MTICLHPVQFDQEDVTGVTNRTGWVVITPCLQRLKFDEDTTFYVCMNAF